MPDPIRIELPVSRQTLARLAAGDEVRLSGPVYTARDVGHARLLAALTETGELPFGLAGQTLFYAGPTPAVDGYPSGSVGPTTAKRMDTETPALLRAGIVAAIGKGSRAEEVRAAFAETGSVYFAAVGGAAALLGAHVVSAEPVAWPELGTEALVRLTLSDFPVFVAHRCDREDLYAPRPLNGARRQEARRECARRLRDVRGRGGLRQVDAAQAPCATARGGGRPGAHAARAGRHRVGEAVRAILLDPEHAGLDDTAEILLYEAARAQLVAEVIEPALEAGEVVLCDRFYDSTTAYQGHARGIPLGHVDALNLAATGGLAPDRTIVLDVDPTRPRARHSQGADRLESEDLAFHQRVRCRLPRYRRRRAGPRPRSGRLGRRRHCRREGRRRPRRPAPAGRCARWPHDPLRLRRPRWPGARGELHARRGRERARQPRVPVRGRPGSGKATAAKSLACAVLCDDNGCGTCGDCYRIRRGAHPDVHSSSPRAPPAS